MQTSWSIRTEWESLESGSPEENAGFAALGICAYDSWLTEGLDKLLQSVRRAPLLSSYHLAEWLAWNWWRLRWEPRKESLEWGLSHRLSSIGGGYIWPNIEIASDGKYVTLVSKPTRARASTPFRYINDSISLIPASDFEAEVDNFILQVLQRLDDRQVADSNLETIWNAVLEERKAPETAHRRKLEALLGDDPDEPDGAALNGLIQDAVLLGASAVEEIAANHGVGQRIPRAAELMRIAREDGFDASPAQGVALTNETREQPSRPLAAWQLGVNAAQAIRAQERIDGSRPIGNQKLADMFGTLIETLEGPARQSPDLDISFFLTETPAQGNVFLRSKWPSGRRFELARLLGDRLIGAVDEPVSPATRAYTYRQKVQRAFAAELLSPFQEVKGLLGADYSMEKQQDVAHHFQVSEWTIRTLLVNHGCVDRGDMDWDTAGTRVT